MIRKLDPPPPQQELAARTPGRYEGLYNFAMKLAAVVGQDLRRWSVLDVGGGDGWLGEILLCGHYVCVDPRSDNPRARVRAEDLDSATSVFELVVSKQTLPHFDDPERAIHQMCRVARHYVVIRQEFPALDTAPGRPGPIGWLGHSKVQIDSPEDILHCFNVSHFDDAGTKLWDVRYDGVDFIARRHG